jgi:FkbM family methyltransferase
VENWPTFLANYTGLSHRGGTYRLRNGMRLSDEEGLLTGTIAVVFLRKHYGTFRDKSVIVDIGANIGVFTLYAAAQCPEARIYSFEPVPKNFACLRRNVASNRLEGRIRTFNLGVAATSGKRTLHLSSSPLHSVFDSEADTESLEIECVTLPEILSSNGLDRIDLMKMNCEGAEYEIFYSAPDDCLLKISEIRMEFHNMDAEENNVEKLIGFLERKGFRTTHFWGNKRVLDTANPNGFLWMER